MRLPVRLPGPIPLPTFRVLSIPASSRPRPVQSHVGIRLASPGEYSIHGRILSGTVPILFPLASRLLR